jgi:Tfp pilus assembly protein PilF
MATVTEALAHAWQVHQQGDVSQAERIYRQVLQVDAANAIAWCYLGIACYDLGKMDEAVAAYQQALRLNPKFPIAHNNLGNALSAQGKLDEALVCFQRALELKPDYANAFNNRAAVFVKQGKFAEAEEAFQQALRLAPNYAPAHANRGAALVKQGKLDEAVASSQEALRHNPGYAEAHKNLGIVLLLQGNFEQGWAEYEWRWKTADLKLPAFRQPLWDGAPLDDKTILLHTEQGLGDTVHFIRYAQLVKQCGGRVVVASYKPLLPLLRSCPGIDELAVQGEPLPPFDVWAPLLSVPRILGTTVATIPANVPYLSADQRLVEQWRSKLPGSETFKIGIAWQGSPQYRDDRQRSIPLVHFASLACLKGVQLFSLQKGPGTEQLATLASRFTVTDLGPQLDQQSGPFMDTAAVMKSLDLVVSADTVIAHVAGALGVPVWTALSHPPHWPWMLQREDTPWYPTMRLFRQKTSGDWQDVFQRMEATLSTQLSSRQRLHAAGTPHLAVSPTTTQLPNKNQPAARPITVEIAPGELIDKITILEIKSERITDAGKLHNVRVELETLAAARDREIAASPQLDELTAQLKAANAALWDIEDDIRDCERDKDFGPQFIELARSVYRTNDRRAALKRQINELLGSKLIEEKSYADY